MFKTPKPRDITILGQTIKVVIDHDKATKEEYDGLYENETIYLMSKYESKEHYLMTIRHECFHALCDLLGMQLDKQTEETLAHRVSYMFTKEVPIK